MTLGTLGGAAGLVAVPWDRLPPFVWYVVGVCLCALVVMGTVYGCKRLWRETQAL